MSSVLDGVQLHYVDNLEAAQAFLDWLWQEPEVALDTETTGLERTDRVRLIQFASRSRAWVIPWEQWLGVVVQALERYPGRWVMFNAKFDTYMVEHSLELAGVTYRFESARVDDVMVMAHIDDPRGRHGLKPLSSMKVDRKAVAAQKMLDEAMVSNKWTWATIPLTCEPYWVYAGMDAVLTLHLKDRYGHISRAAYDLEMGSVWLARRMEDNGIRIDVPFTRAQISSLSAYLEEATSWCQTYYGVSPGSDIKIIERLEQDGVVFTKMTKSGSRFALDKEVLEAIAHPLAGAVLQRRRVAKLVNTYLENFIRMVDPAGLLHPNIHPMMSEDGGARTGRMSITKPALQTLPRKSEANPLSILVRNCFIPREGNVLILCDFDQIEARMGGHFSNDPALIAAFATGDFFSTIAREIYSDPSITKTDDRRQWTKNGVYAIYYGAGGEQVAATLGVPIHEGFAFVQRVMSLYPGLKQFQDEVVNVARRRATTEGKPYVISPLTGRRHVADEGKEYVLINYLIQGTAAEVFKLKLLELDSAGLGEYMVLPVHDEIIMDVPKPEAAEAAHTVREIMTDTELFRVPLTAGVTTAERWGQKAA